MGAAGLLTTKTQPPFPLHLAVGYLLVCTSRDHISYSPLKNRMHYGTLSWGHAMIYQEAKGIGNTVLPPGC